MGTECTRPGELCSETWRGTRTQPGRQRASLCRSCRLWVLSEGSTMDYTPRELMVVCAARQIHDGENVFVGMRLPLIAFALAKRTHAPNCIGIFEAGIVRDVPAAELLYTMGDAPNITGALWATNTMNVMGMLAAGDVDFVTSPGYGYPNEQGPAGTAWRKRAGLPRGGPAALITTLGVFTFDPENGEALLLSYHPGTTIEKVQEQTGWKLRLAVDCVETVPPGAQELKVIREYDPNGVWTG